MTERRKNKLRWLICVVGFVGSTIFFVPDLGHVEVEEPQPPALRAPNEVYPIPVPRPRENGFGLSQPFLFEMASSDKLTGQQRESQLLERYQSVLEKLGSDHFPVLDVSLAGATATITIDGQAFVTVLPQDCPEYFGRLSDQDKLQLEQEVAYAWARVIQDDLTMQMVKRNPVYLSLFNYAAVVMFFVTCMAHLTVTWVSRRFVKSPLWSVKLLLWVLYFTVLTALHPSLDRVAHLLSRGALGPTFDFIAMCVGVAVMHQITHFAMQNYLDDLAEYGQDQSTRAAVRRQTLEQAWTFVSKVVWTLVGACFFLYSNGVDLSQLFAGAGLVGVAIGVMARDILLDFFSGAYILGEDQFGVGDWVELQGESGEVLAFSLRSTKIRRPDGSITTIPNSDLRRVKNHSNEYSVVDFRVAISYQSDFQRSLALILDEIALLETEWQDKFSAPPEPLGVEELGPQGVILRVRIRTVPLAQWEAARRLNARVKKRFDEEGIQFAAAPGVTRVQLLDASPAASVPKESVS